MCGVIPSYLKALKLGLVFDLSDLILFAVKEVLRSLSCVDPVERGAIRVRSIAITSVIKGENAMRPTSTMACATSMPLRSLIRLLLRRLKISP